MSDADAKQFWDDAAKDPEVRYKYIADDWAKTEYFLDLIEDNNKTWTRVLEIGCGIGRLLAPLADNHETCEFYGLDISDEMIKLAQKRPNIHYQAYNDDLDLVFSMLVFQHMNTDSKVEMLNMAYDNLRKGGTLLFQFVIGTEDAPYSYQLSLDEMTALVELAGFTIQKVTEKFVHESWCIIKAIK